MSKKLVNESHAIDMLVELTKQAQPVCKPLLRLGITEFRYARTYDDLTQFNIGSNVPWVSDYYSNDFHKIGTFNKHPQLYESGIVLWEDVGDHRPFIYARDHFNVGKGLTMVEKYRDGCEFFFFGGDVDNPQIVTFLITHLWLLRRYIAYFKSENKRLIKQAAHCRLPLYLPEDAKSQKQAALEEMNIQIELHKKIEEFLHTTQPKKLFINSNGKEVVLTKAECKCVSMLLLGKTADESGQKLFISQRTVERHLSNVKEKLNCVNKVQLAALFEGQCQIL